MGRLPLEPAERRIFVFQSSPKHRCLAWRRQVPVSLLLSMYPCLGTEQQLCDTPLCIKQQNKQIHKCNATNPSKIELSTVFLKEKNASMNSERHFPSFFISWETTIHNLRCCMAWEYDITRNERGHLEKADRKPAKIFGCDLPPI